MSTRDVLRKSKPKVAAVEISSGQVFVRALSGAGRSAYMDLVKSADPNAPAVHRIAALGLCEEDGALVYRVDDEAAIKELGESDGDDLQKIALKLFEISGLASKSVEEAEKNS
jgi:hypothetical protein